MWGLGGLGLGLSIMNFVVIQIQGLPTENHRMRVQAAPFAGPLQVLIAQACSPDWTTCITPCAHTLHSLQALIARACSHD